MTSQVSKAVTVSKWKDKRDVLFLSTKHRPEFEEVQHSKRLENRKMKPSAIVAYNKAKTFIDVSDQIKTYSTAVRRGIKWYRKIAIELICNTAVVNAHILYMLSTRTKVPITEFREKLVLDLLSFANVASNNVADPPLPPDSTPTSKIHKLVPTEKRGRCVSCYETTSAANGRNVAMKLPFISFSCLGCRHKYLCVECFNKKHVTRLKQL